MKRTGLEVPIYICACEADWVRSSYNESLSPLGVHGFFLLLEGRELTNKTCAHQAHGGQDLRRVSQTAKEPGSSRSCAASNGSTWCMNPSGAVLTGVDVPTAPPPVRGGEMMNTSR